MTSEPQLPTTSHSKKAEDGYRDQTQKDISSSASIVCSRLVFYLRSAHQGHYDVPRIVAAIFCYERSLVYDSIFSVFLTRALCTMVPYGKSWKIWCTISRVLEHPRCRTQCPLLTPPSFSTLTVHVSPLGGAKVFLSPQTSR